MKKEKKKFPKIIIIFAILLLIVVFFIQRKENKIRNSINNDQNKIIEINNYEGQNLSSVYDFRENSIKGPQHVDINNFTLKFTGLIDNPIELNYDQVINSYQSEKKVVTLNCVDGWSATILWEGVPLKNLFSNLEIKPEANTVIFHAVDGYTTAFPIQYLKDNNILLAYKMNDAQLIPERGFPFQLVAESKWGYKWIKWIDQIEFSNDSTYQGFWESRGYSDTGNLDQPFFD